MEKHHHNRRKKTALLIAVTSSVIIVILTISYWRKSSMQAVVLASVKAPASLPALMQSRDTTLLPRLATSSVHAVQTPTKSAPLHKRTQKETGAVFAAQSDKGIAKEPADAEVAAQNEECMTPQVQAKFPGGDGEWRKYLERNMNRDLPVENGAPPGNYTTVVSFLVDTDGNISDVRAENNPGYGVAEDAVRVIKAGPKWIPALKDGKSVAYRQRQSFCIYVAEE